MLKKVHVIMLPTENKSIIALTGEKLVKINESNYGFSHIKSQHLYIISDDEIKEGDWCLIDNNKVGKRTNKQTYPNSTDGESHLCYYYTINGEEISYHVSHCKKIIATTDTSLRVPYNNGDMNDLIILPRPSQQFIEEYIEEYNKGNIITDVLIEYETLYSPDNIHWCIKKNNDWEQGCSKTILKINSKDNTITIKKVKNNWNREEVIELLTKLNHTLDIGSNRTFEEWIEENL